MKIYVDELPKTCLDCKNVLCEHQIIEACYATRHPNCPLLSLADHEKQVKNEVLDDVYKLLTKENNWETMKHAWWCNGESEGMKYLLDQLRGENNKLYNL